MNELSMSAKNELKNCNSEMDFIEFCRKAKAMVAEQVITLAHGIKAAQDKGYDIGQAVGLSRSNVEWLIGVADHRVSAELVAALGHKPSVMNKLSHLPLTKQNQIAAGEQFKVYHGLGEMDYTLVCAGDLTSADVKQVFDATGGIRSQQAQVDYIENERKPRLIVKGDARVDEVIYDWKNGVAILGGIPFDVAKLSAIITRLSERSKGVKHGRGR